jgi:tetratricopeptide (TPR) repeat protein
MLNANNLLIKSLEGRLRNASINIQAAKKRIENSDFEKAKMLAEKACIVDEYNLEARYLKGFCHQNLGENSKAADTYKQITRLNPGSAVAHLYLADCLSRTGRTGEAIENYLESIKLDVEGDVREIAQECIVTLKEHL